MEMSYADYSYIKRVLEKDNKRLELERLFHERQKIEKGETDKYDRDFIIQGIEFLQKQNKTMLDTYFNDENLIFKSSVILSCERKVW